MKEVLIVAMSNFFLLSSAQANDFNWAGWYVGTDLGHSSLDANWKNKQAFNPDGSVPLTTPSGEVADSSENMNSTGTIGGINLGYNWLVNTNWVLGLEAKWLIANQDDKISTIPGLDPIGDSYAKVTIKDGAILKVKGGYLATPNTMVYASTGLAYQKIKTESVCPADTQICNPILGFRKSSDSQNYLGWLLGAGLEHAFTEHWVGRLDYSYTNYETNDFTALQFEDVVSFGSKARLNPESHNFSVGVGYKF